MMKVQHKIFYFSIISFDSSIKIYCYAEKNLLLIEEFEDYKGIPRKVLRKCFEFILHKSTLLGVNIRIYLRNEINQTDILKITKIL